jgi:cell wall-associated NlpC family hydrolase
MSHVRARARRWVTHSIMACATAAAAIGPAVTAHADDNRRPPPPIPSEPRWQRIYRVQHQVALSQHRAMLEAAREARRARLRAAREARHARLVARVIAAARSQLGVPYVYASARPGGGFDCSGLVMWAWGRVGVHLPHNSTAIYHALPHVPRAELMPGDVLYFGHQEDHVAIYLGHGVMIHAPHRGDHVRIQPVYWQYFSGAGRPGL